MPSYLSPGVYTEEVSSGSKPIEGVGTAIAAFVGFAERGPVHEPVLVTNWTQFTQTFGGFVPGTYLAHAVYGYFLNGGGSAYIVRIGTGTPPGQDGDSSPAAQLAVAGPGQPLALRAAGDGKSVNVEVLPSTAATDGTFKLVVRSGEAEEVFDNVSVGHGQSNVVNALRRSKLVVVAETKAGTLAMPEVGTKLTLAAKEDKDVVVRAQEYIGDPDDRTGFAAFEAMDDITMLCVPDLMSARAAGMIDDAGVLAVHQAMIAHCELMADRVAILDPPPDLTPQRLKKWRVETAGYDSKFAALYWPWITIVDPLTGRQATVPPSGHLAGIWARNDDTRGVHKAPANESIRGVISLASNLTRAEHDQLNPVGINCVRAFPGQGIRVWGARTLSSDPEWRYLNVRRLFNYLEKSILNGTSWVVFEPNDRYLWSSVERTISMFLRRVWRTGALFGSSPEQAFFVKCDEENNPEENRDAGMLTVDIGVAPVKPAEFVVFRLSQLADGAALQE